MWVCVGAVVWDAGFAVWEFVYDRPIWGVAFVAMLALAVYQAVTSERTFRRLRRWHDEREQQMAELRERYDGIRRAALARIEESQRAPYRTTAYVNPDWRDAR